MSQEKGAGQQWWNRSLLSQAVGAPGSARVETEAGVERVDSAQVQTERGERVVLADLVGAEEHDVTLAERERSVDAARDAET